MQDRFKFRVWLKELIKPRMTYTNGLSINKNQIDDSDNIVMQCTGSKDQNGKLIYEGDIVKMINTEVNFEQVRLVVFKDCAFQFNLPNSMQIDKPLYCWAINYLNHYKYIDLEVIGNIYENPELLEEN